MQSSRWYRKAIFVALLFFLIFPLPDFGQVGTTHGVLVSWTPSTTAGVTGYNVYRVIGTGVPGPNQLITSAPVTGTSYLDPASGLSSTSTYTYYATAVVVTGTGATQTINESGISNGSTVTDPQFPPTVTPPTGCNTKVQ
jgi:hypothetical protein